MASHNTTVTTGTTIISINIITFAVTGTSRGEMTKELAVVLLSIEKDLAAAKRLWEEGLNSEKLLKLQSS